MILKKFRDMVADSIFRERNICFLCGEYNPFIEKNLCGRCRDRYSLIDSDICRICGRKIKVHEEGRDFRCCECIGNKNHCDGGISAFEYRGGIKNLIADFKYREKLYLKDFFAEEMVSVLEKRAGMHSVCDYYEISISGVSEGISGQMDKIDFIVPVPMERKRKKKRGYNQAEILAGRVSAFTGLPLENNMLIRKEALKSQKSLGRIERQINIRNTVEVSQNSFPEGRTVLLVDDVYTTGATVDECARALKEKGAGTVYFLTAASTVYM